MIAARRFLEELAKRLTWGSSVLLADAFLSNKPERSSDQADALLIAKNFWTMPVEELRPGLEAIWDGITGIPPVRCFAHPLRRRRAARRRRGAVGIDRGKKA